MTHGNKVLLVDAINTTLNYINQETKEIAVSNLKQNKELLDKVQSLPIRKIVVTNAPADLIKNALHGYDFEVFSCNNDPSKVEPEFYANFLEHYNLNPQDCSYFDHKQANIDSAKQVGINGVLFENNDQVMAYFSEMM